MRVSGRKGLAKVGILSAIGFFALVSIIVLPGILALHNLSVSVSPQFIQPSIPVTHVFQVTNTGPGGDPIHTVVIDVPLNFNATACSGPPGWIVTSGNAPGTQICHFGNGAPIVPGSSANFTVGWVPPSVEGPYQWTVQTTDIFNFTFSSFATNPIVTVDGTSPSIIPLPTLYPLGQSAAKNGDTVIVAVNVTDPAGVSLVEVNASALGCSPTLSMPLFSGNTYAASCIVSSAVEGQLSLPVTATDGAGNQNTASVSVLIDNIPPLNVTFVEPPTPPNGSLQTVSLTTVEVSFVETNPASCVVNAMGVQAGLTMMAIHGAPAANNTCSVFFPFVPDDTYNYNVTVIDAAGNSGTSPQRTLTVDANPPTTNATLAGAAGANSWFVSPSVNVTLSCADAVFGLGCNQTFFCTDLTNTCTPSVPYNSPFAVSGEGVRSVRYFSTDPAGNTEATKSTPVMIDTITPFSAVLPLPAFTTVAVFSVPFAANDTGSGIAFVTLFFRKDNGSWSSFGQFNSSPISFNSSSTGDGLYEFEAVATDVAGNTENQNFSTEASTTVDTLLPFITSAITGSSLAGSSTAANNILVSFSEPVNCNSVSPGDFGIGNNTAGFNAQSATQCSSFNGTRVLLTLLNPIQTGETPVIFYNSGFASGIQDVAGNTMSSVNVTPSDGLSPVMASAITRTVMVIDVTFTEDLNPTTVSPSDFQVVNGQLGSVPVGSVAVFSGGIVRLTLTGTIQDPENTPTINLVGPVADLSGNVVSSGSVVADAGIFPPTENITITFHKGWNFFSVAKALINPSISAALANLQYTQIGTLNTNNKLFETPNTIVPLVGYFVNVTVPANITFTYSTGTANQQIPPVRPLKAGWNTVGTTHNGTMDAGPAFNTIDSIYSQVCGIFSNPTNTGSVIQCGINNNPHLIEPMGFSTIEGRGYWIFNTADSPPDLASQTV